MPAAMAASRPAASPDWTRCETPASEMDVRMIACEAGLRAEALDPALLLPGVEVAGIATFLEAVGTGQLITI